MQAEKIKPPEYIQNNEYLAVYDDTATWLAEVLDGPMHTEFTFEFNGQDLIGADGRVLGEIFDNALNDAKNVAEKSPQLKFELRRREIEKTEYLDMIKMAKGELPNTMVVLSDFPLELMHSNKSVGGYNVNRKQTMLRIISRQSNGNIRIQTQSLDGSVRLGLEAIYDSFGVKPEAGELLGQRINIDIPEQWHDQLCENLTAKYDSTLEKSFGGNWHGGRTPAEIINTFDFVRRQHDLIDHFVVAWMHDRQNAENIRYGLAAAIRDRFYNKHHAKQVSYVQNPNQQLMIEIQNAGQNSLREGRSFSGCGLTLNALESGVEDNLKQLGFGNNTEETYKFDQEMFCVVCQSPPKKEDKKKMCGPCGICKTCDAKLSKASK